MTPTQSPIPVFGALAGLSVGTAAGALGEALCRGCGLIIHSGVPAVGAVAGALVGGAVGIWAGRRGGAATVVAAAVLALVFAGGPGALATDQVWRRMHPVIVREPTIQCRVPARSRRPVCEPGRDLVLRLPPEEIDVGAALAGGLTIGAAGAAIAVSLQRRSRRRRTGLRSWSTS